MQLAYNVLIILLLKYGSSNILWLCLTLQVPIANLAFALPFMPNSAPVSWEGGVGLLVIMCGLIIYRFYNPLVAFINTRILGRAPPPPKPVAGDAAALLADGSEDPALADTSGLVVGSESPSAVGGSTPIRGMFTHVTRGHKSGGADATAQRAQAVAAARQKVAAAGGSGAAASGRARGGSQ